MDNRDLKGKNKSYLLKIFSWGTLDKGHMFIIALNVLEMILKNPGIT